MLTQAGDLQRQVLPLSQSHDPGAAVPAFQALGSAIRLRRWPCAQDGAAMPGAPGDSPRHGTRPAGEESRDPQGKTGAQVSFQKVKLERREMYFCACNSTTNTEVMVL